MHCSKLDLFSPQRLFSDPPAYWGSEHGAIVLTSRTPVRPGDISVAPLPWVAANIGVWCRSGQLELSSTCKALEGELVLSMARPFPSLARTIWGRGLPEGHSREKRKGGNECGGVSSDGRKQWQRRYFHKSLDGAQWFVQGDSCTRGEHSDQCFIMTGRSDDVINVRFGGQIVIHCLPSTSVDPPNRRGLVVQEENHWLGIG